jgi:cation diffusion facilitator CzcD-associated flavoprotein CzcO
MKEHLDVLVVGARRRRGAPPAVTLVPAIGAAVADLHRLDACSRSIADFLRRVLATLALYELNQRKPDGYDIRTHFTPRYKPWDHHFRVVPSGDLFNAISAGSASLVSETYREIETPLSGAMVFS